MRCLTTTMLDSMLKLEPIEVSPSWWDGTLVGLLVWEGTKWCQTDYVEKTIVIFQRRYQLILFTIF